MPVQLEYFDGGVRRIWKPFPRQEKFISLPDEVFEGFYGGAVGGGKSELIVLLPILRGWHKNRHFRGIIFRRTIPELKESLIPRSQEIYEAEGAVYNAQDHIWKFPSGATIKFSHLESMADARSHDTAEFHYAGFDELTHFAEEEYLYVVLSRIRSTIPELPAIARSASNPGNIGHGWVRSRFVEPERSGSGDTLIHDVTTNTLRAFVRSSLTDNPYLMEHDPNYINRLRGLSPHEYKAKVEGDWWVFAGQVFDEFRIDKLEGEPSHALHVLPRDQVFFIPSWWPRVLSIDWGGTNPNTKAKTWAGWFAVGPKRRAYLYREYTSKDKIKIWASDIARLSVGEPIKRVVLDPSAWANRGDEHTIQEQFVQASGFRQVQRADNDRLGGKALVHEYFRWKPKPPRFIPLEGFDPSIAERVFRMQGSRGLRDYKAMFEPEPAEDTLPKLLVFPHCNEFIDVIPKCIYNETGKAKNPEDVKEFDGDDAYDGGRYGIKAVDNFIEFGDEDANERDKQAEIVARLQETGDYTGYYRRLEKLERGSKTTGPIRLFHSSRSSRGTGRR